MPPKLTQPEQEKIVQDTITLIAQLADEGERAAVVLGAARLDLELEHLLKAAMAPHAGGTDNLFDPDRPLGSFSAKIALAHRLSLVDADVEHALQMVRRIRNNFAHSVTKASLSESQYQNRIREFSKTTKRAAFADFHDQIFHAISTEVSSELREFSAAIMIMLMMLQVASLGTEPLKPAFQASFPNKL